MASDKEDDKSSVGSEDVESQESSELQEAKPQSTEVMSAQSDPVQSANADELKEACVAFIKENAAEVMETSGWSKVASYQAGSLALEVMRAMAGLSRPGKKRPSPGSQDPAASSSSQVNSRARRC